MGSDLEEIRRGYKGGTLTVIPSWESQDLDAAGFRKIKGA